MESVPVGPSLMEVRVHFIFLFTLLLCCIVTYLFVVSNLILIRSNVGFNCIFCVWFLVGQWVHGVHFGNCWLI